MQKKLIFLTITVLILVLMLTVFGCKTTTTTTTAAEVTTAAETTVAAETTAAATTSTKILKIGYSTWDLTNPYFVQISKGVEDRCKELGYEITINDCKQDSAKQVAVVENFILQKMDVIIISPFDPVSMESVVKKAKDAGIIVINGNQEIKGPVDAFITIPEYAYGKLIGTNAGNWIVKKLGGKAEVAVLTYTKIASVIDRGKGIMDTIKEMAPEAKIVATQDAASPDEGMKAMEIILQAHPNIQVLAAVNDGGALGAYEAIMAAKKDTENFCICGGDADKEALQKIKDGTIYRATVDIQPYNSGKLFVDTAIDVMKNGPKKETVVFPHVLVTSENIGDYFK